MMIFGSLVMVFSFIVILVGVFVALRFVGGTAMRRSRGAGDRHESLDSPTVQKDPITIVRERYARGEIDHDELERYLGNLVKGEHPRRSFGDPPGVDQPPPPA
ncbi:MAG: SHOCT domain-containing protein [Ferrimicrobium sp.]